MAKRKHDIEQELAKYRSLINKGYVEENGNDDTGLDIMKLCVKKKFERDVNFYGKIRPTFFDNFLSILTKWKNKEK